MIIALDKDDTLIEFNRGFLRWYNRRFGMNIAYDDLTSYNIEDCVGCSREDMIQRIFDYYESPEILTSTPMPGVMQVVEFLRNKGNKLYLITARPKEVMPQTLKVVNNYFPKVFEEVIFTGGFSRNEETERRSKSEVCLDLGASVILEDAAHHANDCAKSGVKAILLERPWNRKSPTDSRVVRVGSYGSAVREIISQNH